MDPRIAIMQAWNHLEKDNPNNLNVNMNNAFLCDKS